MVCPVVGNGRSTRGKGSHKCNNNTGCDNSTCRSEKASIVDPEAGSQTQGPKYACGH